MSERSYFLTRDEKHAVRPLPLYLMTEEELRGMILIHTPDDMTFGDAYFYICRFLIEKKWPRISPASICYALGHMEEWGYDI